MMNRMNDPLRIAFLTNEFVIEKPDSGGLGNYLNRITQTLRELGHQPEIFVSRKYPETPTVVDFNGVRVEHVEVIRNRAYWWFRRFDQKFLHSPWGGPAEYIGTALALSRALEQRHMVAPFDLVQSSNCGASGLLVRRKRGRRHIARFSSVRDLTFAVDGLLNGWGARAIIWLEWAAVNRADLIYAPSQFIADYYWREKKANVRVLRPPVFLEVAPAAEVSIPLPPRYLIHFGSIGDLKGSDVLAAALPIVWQEASDLQMIWAGPERIPGDFARYQRLWGEKADNVQWTGALPKPELYAILQRAEAAVLPSRVDNLPNTVIESLMLGVPVIGSDGASIDELVEPGVSGALVPIGDHRALAQVMLTTWQCGVPWLGDGFQRPSQLDDLKPDVAAQNLLRLAGFSFE